MLCYGAESLRQTDAASASVDVKAAAAAVDAGAIRWTCRFIQLFGCLSHAEGWMDARG